MNEHEIVSSGLLESYVLGITSQEETTQVEKLLSTHPEYQSQVDDIRESLEAFAWQHAVEPPVAVREKVLGSIQELAAGKVIPMTGSSSHNLSNQRPGLSVTKTLVSSRNWVAAAAVIMVLSVVGNIFLFKELKASEDLVATLESNNTQLAKNLEVNKASFMQARQEVAVLQNPGTKMMKLEGEPIAPTAFAMLYWNDSKRETYMANVQLPTAPSGKQYQIWAIVDGKPVDAGLFDQATSMQKVKSITGASAYAISLEPEGGSPQPGPTGQVYLKGSLN